MKKLGAAPSSSGGGSLGPLKEGENAFLSIPTEALKNLPRPVLLDLFAHYDSKSKGYLKPSHPAFHVLAGHVVARILLWFEATLREKNPKVSAKELKDIVAKERQFLLPGGSDKEQEATPNMVKFLYTKMGQFGQRRAHTHTRAAGRARSLRPRLEPCLMRCCAGPVSPSLLHPLTLFASAPCSAASVLSPPVSVWSPRVADVNKDGKVTKEEFLMTWNGIISGLLVQREGGPLDCCIM